jgi:transglutaminase-like putative cysteine protease
MNWRVNLLTPLRAAALALAAVVVMGPLTVMAGVVAAALAAFAGSCIADAYQRREEAGPLRTRGAALATALIAGVGSGVAAFLADQPGWTASLGVAGAVALVEALRATAVIGGLAFLVRTAAARSQPAAVAEVALVAGAVAISFSAHRGGQVHRPLGLSDWAWSHAIDPALVFLVLGVAATGILAALLVAESRRLRLPIHALAIVLLGVLVIAGLQGSGLSLTTPDGGLGLTGEAEPQPEDAKEGKGQRGKTDRRDMLQLEDLPFRDDYESNGDQAPVAVVVLHDDHSPPTGVYYFRQTAFSHYNGFRLVESASGYDEDVLRIFPSRPWEVPDAPPVSASRASLPTSFGLLVDHVKPFALDSPARVEPRAVVEDFRFQRTYHVVSHVQTLPYERMLGGRAGDPDWTTEEWTHYTTHPADPRYRELARRLLDDLAPEYQEDPLARAIAVKSYLDKEGIYSLKSRHASADDPAASFLFGDLTGYCVHFAHAATYLFRSLGLPARVAAGYAVPEADRAGGSALLVRGGNAHAWPEIHLEGVGWVVVDLAPETALDGGLAAADPELQRLLGEMLREQLREVPFEEPGTRWTPADLRGLALRALAALVAVAFALKLWRRIVPWLAPVRARPRLFYRAALDRLSELGQRRRFGETREAFARRQQERAPSFGRLTDVHLRAAFGGGPGMDAPGLGAVARTLREELTATPLWRRLLGGLDPIAWMRSR